MPESSHRPVPSPGDPPHRQPLSGLLYDPRFRSWCIQVAFLAAIFLALSLAAINTAYNLKKAGIASGFGFLSQLAGFDISQSLIAYSRTSSYGRAFWVGFLNTLLVAGVSIVLSTLLGFLVGILRLSGNWLVSRLAYTYIDVVRNIPLLLQLLFWYMAILNPLPGPKQALALYGMVFLCNRGLIVPKPIFGAGSEVVVLALALAVIIAAAVVILGKRRQRLTGKRFPVFWGSAGVLFGLPFLALVATGFPLHWEVAVLEGFNFSGGLTLLPEFTALVLGLTLYTAAFIAENVRAGIQAVPRAQIEASRALGLRPSMTLRMVVIPQALRVIIPPLTSQHLTLVKNSSLAVVIGYPDLMSVFAGTALNQTGQAVEIIAITMLVYLTVSLTISAVMNWYNAKIAIRER
jgi:general L-amino acid transport system permease protein